MALLSPPALLLRQEWLMGPQGPSLRGGRPQPKISAVNLLGENSVVGGCLLQPAPSSISLMLARYPRAP